MEKTQTRKAIVEGLRKAAHVMRIKGYAPFTRHHSGGWIWLRMGKDEKRDYPKGSVCALGAIEDALGVTHYSAVDSMPIVTALAKVAVDSGVKGIVSTSHASEVASWSNALVDTPEVVIAGMEQAADLVEAGKITVDGMVEE